MITRRIAIVLVAGLLMISACAPLTPTAQPSPSSSEQNQSPVVEEQTPPPSVGKTPLPSSNEEIPQPTRGILIPQEEAPMIFEKIQSFVADHLKVSPDSITLLELEEVEWSDGCLGLGGPAESCIQVITPGYRALVEVNGSTLEVRTDQDASQIRLNRGLNTPEENETEEELDY
ncbi:MAG: hypothetical protein AB1522_05750 [Chloroflexota bacterium]